MDNAFIQEKLLPGLTFNPGLALTGFRTTRLRCTRGWGEGGGGRGGEHS